MKYILLVVAAASTLWQLSIPHHSWWDFFLLSAMSVSWILCTVYTYDCIQALTGRSSPYYREFYGELKKDFCIALFGGLSLTFIVNMSSADYSFSNIDIAFAGYPFLLLSAYDSFALQKRRIVGVRLPKYLTRSLIGAQAFIIGAFNYYLIKINSSAFTAAESLWIQITLLLTALSLCIWSHQILFILTKQKMEISPAIITIFESINVSQGIYKQAGELVERWNKNVFEKKQEQRATRAKKRKR
ncbi:hypothetical protein [Pseudomonas tussilaginis]|uniref:hypothetical protein n=1 Tax=Pseudomonas putida TaxID=303 RepID=UPI002363511E|nr:hypothetical protein [Pseudomonas putida]MDD1976201.1 hypothetical protein [Pseudomonas putida]